MTVSDDVCTGPAGRSAGGTQTNHENFKVWNGRLVHEVQVNGIHWSSSIAAPDIDTGDPKGSWWRSYLTGSVPESTRSTPKTLRAIDLFCGCGGLAAGVSQFASEVGVRIVTELAVDEDVGATAVYAANHETRLRRHDSVSSLVDFRVRGWGESAEFVFEPELIHPEIADVSLGADLLIAGPPCQGHSNLNNRTRRQDKRNLLYLTIPAFALAAKTRVAIIENVPEVEHDQNDVVGTARSLFANNGYKVETGVLDAAAMGWPQTRRRFFLIATLDSSPVPLRTVTTTLSEEHPRALSWALQDIIHCADEGPMDRLADLSLENRRRVDWLFENDEYDLADHVRPLSQMNGTTYRSVYGRMKRDAPAPTITTGFMTPGRGRFIHPTERRTLSPKEAARLQGFPDAYSFVTDSANPPSRASLCKWIGDAVPMPLGYGAAVSALLTYSKLALTAGTQRD